MNSEKSIENAEILLLGNIYDKALQRQKDQRALVKAKAVEEQRLKKGWKFVRINKTTQILVECGKDGQPNQNGLKRIERYKKQYR